MCLRLSSERCVPADAHVPSEPEEVAGAAQSLALGTHLHFEFYEEAPPGAPAAPPGAGGLRAIDLPRLDAYPDAEQAVLAQLCARFGVPAPLRRAPAPAWFTGGAALRPAPWLWAGGSAGTAAESLPSVCQGACILAVFLLTWCGCKNMLLESGDVAHGWRSTDSPALPVGSQKDGLSCVVK